MKTKNILKVLICCVFVMAVSSCSAEEPPKKDVEKAAVEKPSVQEVATPQQAATVPNPDTRTPIPEPAPSKYDFSDSSHWNLTVSAWEHMAQKDYEGTFAYAQKCIELYEDKAKEAAKSMHNFIGFGHEDDYAVVNDVATSHYIMGEAYMKMGDTANAQKEFELVIKEYPYSQCWDPKGWFWKVAEVSKKNIEKIGKQKIEPAK